jgi:aerobic carbon-monoxide dehydrogenase medium subunit
VKNPPFTYHRPSSIDEALALLAEHGDDAKVLAGGQSLLPIMALRLGRPEHLVDIGRLPGLDRIEHGDNGVTIGALVRHSTAERSEVLASHAPVVADAMPHIGHRAIRNRGTVCGSVAHADPAAELPAVALALDATIVARSATASREIPASEFFLGYLQTALRSEELLTEVRLAPWPASSVGAVTEVSRRHGDYALVGCVTRLDLDGGAITAAALAYFGVAGTPVRVPEAEQTLVGHAPEPDLFARAGSIVAEQLQPSADVHATASYRRHLAGVLTRRGLTAATSRIGVPA